MTFVQTTTPSCPLLAVMSPLQREGRVGWELKDGDEWKVKQVRTNVWLGHQCQTFWGLIWRTDDNKSVQTYHLNQLWPPNVFFPAYWTNELELMRTSGYQVTHVTQSGHSPHMEEKWNRENNCYFFVFNICHSEWLAHPHNGDRLPAIGEQLENFIISFYDAIYLSRTLVKVISAVKLAESANDFCRLRQLFFRSSITSSYLRWQRIHPPSSSPSPSSPLT